MKENNNKDELISNNKIWYNFFVRSANSFIFDLLDSAGDLNQFSDEQLFRISAICDNIIDRSKIFRDELEKRVK